MRSLSYTLASAQPATGNFSTVGVSLEGQYGYAIQIIATGSPVGTVTIQGSNDIGAGAPQYGPVNGQNVVNWSTITTQAISGAASFMSNQGQAYYRWVRCTYTFTSGSGAITIEVVTKGV